MIAVIEITQISENELVGAPMPHTLATGKNIFVFNLQINAKTSALKTGHVFEFGGEFYEVMNHYRVEAPTDYLKLNCFQKSSAARND